MKKTIATFICTTSLVFSLSSTEHSDSIDFYRGFITTHNPFTQLLAGIKNWNDYSELSPTETNKEKDGYLSRYNLSKYRQTKESFLKSYCAFSHNQHTKNIATLYKNMMNTWNVIPYYIREFKLSPLFCNKLKALITAYATAIDNNNICALKNYPMPRTFLFNFYNEECLDMENRRRFDMLKVKGLEWGENKEATIFYWSQVGSYYKKYRLNQIPKSIYIYPGINILKDNNKVVSFDDNNRFRNKKSKRPNIFYCQKTKTLNYFTPSVYWQDTLISVHDKNSDSTIFLGQNPLENPQDSLNSSISVTTNTIAEPPLYNQFIQLQVNSLHPFDPFDNNDTLSKYRIKTKLTSMQTISTSSKNLNIKRSDLKTICKHINVENFSLPFKKTSECSKLIFDEMKKRLDIHFCSKFPKKSTMQF